MLALTDQSRTFGFVTSGPKRSRSVCSMHTAIREYGSDHRMWESKNHT